MAQEIQNIGFIGTGVMGNSMAGHLIKAGYKLHIFTRTKSKAESLIEKGAKWHDSCAALAPNCQLIITIVGEPQDVEEIYLSQDGLINHATKGCILIDMTTSDPRLAQKISEAAARKGLTSLDAPVSGGDTGARNAKLSIMVGGDKEAFDLAHPILSRMGENIVYQGQAGSGQNTKMVNQICIAASMVAVSEALAYGKGVGLDLPSVMKSISSGAAGSWTLSNLAPRMLKGDFQPGFFIKHFVKDMNIAKEISDENQLNTPGLSLALSYYKKMMANGKGGLGTQALFGEFTQD